MAYHYEFDSRNRILLAVVYGRVDDSEMHELYFGIRKRKDEVHALTGIVDFTGVTDLNVRSETIRGLANLPPNFEDPVVRAAVAPTDFLFGIARMFQAHGAATREQLHIVRTLNEALVLLGVESSHFHRTSAA
jgi:hypothetical protein